MECYIAIMIVVILHQNLTQMLCCLNNSLIPLLSVIFHKNLSNWAVCDKGNSTGCKKSWTRPLIFFGGF